MNRITLSRTLTVTLLAGFALFAPITAHAEEYVWATGRVYTAGGKRPLANAIVAVYDDKNRVVDHARTDANGEYGLAVPKSALHLDKKGGGFLRRVASAMGGVGRMVAMPLKAGVKMATSAANFGDPITKAGVGAAGGLAGSVIDSMTPRGKGKGPTPERSLPGVLVMKVTLPGHNDAVSLGHVYWMEELVYKTDRKEERTLTAWMDPVALSGEGSDRPSEIASTYLTFTDARMEPSIAEVGHTVRLRVRFPSPPEPRTPVVVVAKNNRTGKLYELQPSGRDEYSAEIVIDKKFPKNDQTFTVVAYAEQDEQPGRVKKTEDGLNGAGFFDPQKPYVYNPLLVVSRNRAEVVLTVVEPAKRR